MKPPSLGPRGPLCPAIVIFLLSLSMLLSVFCHVPATSTHVQLAQFCSYLQDSGHVLLYYSPPHFDCVTIALSLRRWATRDCCDTIIGSHVHLFTRLGFFQGQDCALTIHGAESLVKDRSSINSH